MSTVKLATHHDHGDQHHEVLHDRIVAPADRLDQEAGDAGDVEHGLGDDQAADQERRLDADHGDDRQNGVLQRVMIIDRSLGGALGAGGADIILPQDLQHRGAGDAHGQRRAAEADRHRRHGVDRERLGPGLRVRIEDRHRAEQRHRRHQDQQAEPERGQRQSAQADHAQGVVEPRALLHRADDAERNADRGREQQRQPRKPRRDRNARQDFLQRRLLGHVGIAEIAVQQAADPVQILHDDRLVEAELLLQIGLVGGIDIAGGVKQDVDDIAGHDAQQHEDDDRDPEQGHEHQDEAPHEISKHLALSLELVSVVLAGGSTCPSRRPRNDSRYRSCSHHGDALDIGLPAGAGAARGR